MLLGVGADWQDVMIAALTFAGVVVNAAVAFYIARQVRAPSGGTLGQHVENASQAAQAAAMTGLANARRLKAMNGEDDDDDEPLHEVGRG